MTHKSVLCEWKIKHFILKILVLVKKKKGKTTKLGVNIEMVNGYKFVSHSDNS